VVVGDQASQDDNAHPNQERHDRQPLDGSALTTTVLTATRNIFNQNEKVTSSRTGSPMTIRIPVTNISHNPPVSHGPNRLVVCRRVWSIPAHPRMRRQIMNTDPKTAAMPTM